MHRRRKFILAAAAVLILAAVLMTGLKPEEPKEISYEFSAEKFFDTDLPDGTKVLEVDIFDYETAGTEISVQEFDGVRALVWDNASGMVRFSINSPEAAIYNMIVSYSVPEDSFGLIERGLLINGECQYDGQSNILFSNRYRDAAYPFEKDEYNNDSKPRQVRVSGFFEQLLYDRNCSYLQPVGIALKQGVNTIELTAMKGTVAISSVKLVPPETIPDYKEYRLNEKANGASGFYLEIEAEDNLLKSGKNIQNISISEPGVTPEKAGTKLLNAVGGEKYANAHDFIEWSIEVPENGYYNLAFRYKQNFNSSLTSFRKLTIDGKRVFAELDYIGFPYGSDWKLEIPGENRTADADGGQEAGPFQLYLEKGVHTLHLEVTNAPYRTIKNLLHKTNEGLTQLDLYVRELLGTDEDVYRLWKIEEYIPDLKDTLNGYVSVLNEALRLLQNLTGRSRTDFGTLTAAVSDMEEILADPDLLTKNSKALSDIYTVVSNWEINVTKQPLLLDKLIMKSTDMEFEEKETGLLGRLSYSAAGFFRSFAASSMQGVKKGEDDGAIQVWVQRNRDYVDLMQQLANEYYTKETGIAVNINYCPPGMNLLVLANASGRKPDIVTGVDIGLPFEFAVRDALVDLSEYPEFEEIIKDIAPGSRIPYQIGTGEYAIAEEVKVNVTYYRKDVLERLGLTVPDTWEDTTKTLSTLLQNNYNYFYPYGDYLTFFYQRGVEVYTKDGLDIAFDSQAGYEAFQYWTDLYLKYGIDPKMASFYQHFRLGDVPLGVTGIDQYLTLDLAAPDISGKWEIALAPGTLNADGQIIRYEGGTQNGAIMFRNGKERQDRAWDFLKWWFSADTQFLYADDLENFYGEEFRYFSANVSVVEKQGWNDRAKEVLLEQLKWYKQVPMVPGGSYMTSREIWNAWTRTVIDHGNFREQLAQAVDSILIEMKSKQLELGYIDEDGFVLKRVFGETEGT